MNVWKQIKRPIIGLAPMDGITDVVFRRIVEKYGKPSILFTEFVPVEAIKANAISVLKDFSIQGTHIPTIAQLYGVDLEGFRIATLIVCELGFRGLDINMGCPAKSVAGRGAGAGLIHNPSRAREIIRVVNQSISDWQNGAYENVQISDDMRTMVHMMKNSHNDEDRTGPALSIKTRIGYRTNEVESWLQALAQEKLDAITIHGRTFVQGYGGKADWDAISRGAEIVRTHNKSIVVLGNGDITSKKQAEDYCSIYHVEGILVGRGAWGNPWVFTDEAPSMKERLNVALEHTRLFVECFPDGHFAQIRKHLGWYCTHFPHSHHIHEKLIRSKSLEEVEEIVAQASQCQ